MTTQQANESNRNKQPTLQKEAVKHMVIFSLKYEKEDENTRKFFDDSKIILSAIPGVLQFEAFQQASSKNDFQYGFSMVFNNAADYEAYNQHPAHTAFLESHWKIAVTHFMEIDLKVF